MDPRKAHELSFMGPETELLRDTVVSAHVHFFHLGRRLPKDFKIICDVPQRLKVIFSENLEGFAVGSLPSFTAWLMIESGGFPLWFYNELTKAASPD